MSSTNKRTPHAPSRRVSKPEQKLLTLARGGDRTAYLHLFMASLPDLDRFTRHEIHYSETIGAVERGLIDPCAILDQVYIAGLNMLSKMPKLSFRVWLRYLALHILRQQVRVEHREEPAGLSLEDSLQQDASEDTDLWEFYQPDDVLKVEDMVEDPSSTDPESVLESRETETEIEDRINTLPSEMRELLKLRFLEGLSVNEIAKTMRLAPEDVRRTMQQACEALRDLSAVSS